MKHIDVDPGKWYAIETATQLVCCQCACVHDIAARYRNGRIEIRLRLNQAETKREREKREHD